MSHSDTGEKHPLDRSILTGYAKVLASHKLNIHHDDVLAAHQQAFSVVDCTQCAACCISSPPLINPSDAKRISRHLGISAKQFYNKYTIEDTNGEISMAQVPCIFLSDQNLCKIYAIRPEACKGYPHTDDTRYMSRMPHNTEVAVRCPAASRVLSLLYKKIDL